MENLSTVSTVILAGGLGTRLRSIVDDRPKVLADVHGRPFLTYLLDQLLDYGVKSVVLCTGHRGDQVRTEFGDTYRGLGLAYSHEPSPLGTAGALRLALPLLESESILVLNGDSLCGADLNDFWKWHHAHSVASSILLVRMTDTTRYGRVVLDDEGCVLEFVEKSVHDEPGLINAGIYLARRQLLGAIPEGRSVSLEHEIFPTWIGQGFCGYIGTGPFIDIGTPESYALAEQVVVSRDPT
jgi:D-glycero-alpha-D-manno-heptose 1-phosphate guanylyltransferase